jgi:DNA-directed RNA polymerase specialized sigma24 family protein
MSKSYTPTYILLQILRRSQDREEADQVLRILVERFGSQFEKHARKHLSSHNDIEFAMDETFVEIHGRRDRYHEQGSPCAHERIEQGGECTLQYQCVEKAALAYLWKIHKCNVIDQQRHTLRCYPRYVEQSLDEAVYVSECDEPDATVIEEAVREDLRRAYFSLEKRDQELLREYIDFKLEQIDFKPGPGRPSKALQQARRQALARLEEAIRKFEEE